MTKLRVVKNAKGANNPPRPLGPAGSSLWKRVTSEYNVSDSGGREMLCLAAETLDRVEALRAALDRDGEVVVVKGIPREHPALKGELAGRSFISKVLLRLGLSVEVSTKPVGRPTSSALGVTRLDFLENGDA